ncbi:nitrite reductase small subunit NirD [Pseudonocardia asaccharolytica]|uniref:Nitrite reductase small subunit n=1 Tax=Pseudonocardia asaccharolytica DSM 44247 = NBRC 16224 TaxID=1123024 RepID=A0A511CWP0_9PSEU|nr:nitrite reductase small subunit NirD [Pseudonocardia asaccharolytica]GEL16985.1 nitrite reductase small subunit [Pseudonocardia asaccharolytica DSM 44247 = NBRC 16224]
MRPTLVWHPVCPLERLQPERGAAALLGDRQVALFHTHDGTVHAIGNIDPFSGAAVLSRGIVGDRGGVPMVASPVYKQAFSLLDGRCLDDPDTAVPWYPVRISDGRVEVGVRVGIPVTAS